MAGPKRYPEHQKFRENIAGHLKVAWARYKKAVPGGTQRAFASELGVHEGTVSKVLRGKSDAVGLDLFIALAKNRDADDILKREPEAAQRVSGSGAHARLPKPRAAESPPIQGRAAGHGSSR